MKLGPFMRGAGGLAAAFALAWASNRFGVENWLYEHLVSFEPGAPYEEWFAKSQLFQQTWSILRFGYGLSLVFATLLMPAAFLVRVLGRARARAGFRDPFEEVRTFLKDRSGLRRALLLIGPMFWAYLATHFIRRIGGDTGTTEWAAFAVPALAVVATQYALLRRGLRAFLAPALDEQEIANEQNAEGLTFRAVAVTHETRAAVGALGLLSVIMFGAAYSLPVPTLAHNPLFVGALLGYFALATGGAIYFVQASRINVGLDGVYISGTARARFVPFREIDDVRVSGSNIDLMRGDHRVLRLQLHGEDALRKNALAERIRAAIATAAEHQNSPAVAFVSNADVEKIQRAAEGAANYREVTPSRDKLWDVLESPAVDAKARAAAASALAASSDDAERERLRKMGENCAEPAVRARIAELLEEEDEPVEQVPARRMSLGRIR